MDRQKPRKSLGRINYRAAFPTHLYPKMRPVQIRMFDLIGEHDGRLTIEAGTGEGKTEVGYAFLKTLAGKGQRPLFYVAPTKTLVGQIKSRFPELAVAYGRHEHPCLHSNYIGQDLKADEIPCLTIQANCPHFVDQKTGATNEPGVRPCPYYQQKFEARRAPIVLSTMAFYLMHQLFPASAWEEAEGLVLDEAHDIARVVRSILSYEITDWHLGRAVELVKELDEEASDQLKRFLRTMLRIIKRKPPAKPTLLDDDEIVELIEALEPIDRSGLQRKLTRTVETGKIDPVEHRQTLRQLEIIIRDLWRYIHSLEYALPGKKRHALNYTYAYWEEELAEGKRVQHRLVIKAHYVAPIIAKIVAPRTLAYSATIGDPEIFAYETGIQAPAFALGSEFPTDNARIYMPTDTPNLAMRVRRRQDVTKSLRRIARAAKRFSKANQRSLVVVISEVERQKFLKIAVEERLDALSYGDGVPAKEVAARFRDGEGEALVGTAAQYGEGVDLPRQVAPVIFMLRPGYPKPDDPAALFEERRFSEGQVWAIRRWRVMIEALQVRGRNIRSAEDLGVSIFISQHFRPFVYASLPEWLREAYRGDFTFDQCISNALELLERR